MNAITKTVEGQVINGIDVGAVQQLVEDISRNPKAAMTNWRVSTQWQGQTHSRTQIEGYSLGGQAIAREFTLEADEPFELCGTNRFPNPQEYLLAALNACMTVGYVAQCALRGIVLEKLTIETEGDLDLRGFLGLGDFNPGYDELSYTVTIKGNASEAEFAEVHAAVQATSPNFHNLARPVALKAKLLVA